MKAVPGARGARRRRWRGGQDRRGRALDRRAARRRAQRRRGARAVLGAGVDLDRQGRHGAQLDGSPSFPAPLKWSDVGSLLALEDVAEPDDDGNVRSGRGVDIDSHNNIVYSTDRLVATLGVEDLIVVDTTDATLVLPKERAQDVRQVVDALKAIGAPEVTQPKVSLRPWGSWRACLQGPGYQIKLLEVKPGARLSLQKHHHRSEHWIVVAGTAVVTRDDETHRGARQRERLHPGRRACTGSRTAAR